MIPHRQLSLAEVFENCQNKFDNDKYQFLNLLNETNNLDDSYDPYKAAYGSMPTHAASNPAIQQMYINGHFCYSYKFGIASRKTQNEKTLHADLLLAGITQLITMIVADKIHKHEYLRSLKPLIA